MKRDHVNSGRQREPDVRFTPKADKKDTSAACPLSARSGHMHRSKRSARVQCLIRSPRRPIVRRSKRATLMGRCESSPAVDFAHQSVDQIRTVDSRKIVRHWISNGCKTVGQKAIARTKGFQCSGINCDRLARDHGSDLVAQIHRIETEKAPHAFASFGAKQQSCMTGQHHLDALQLERYVDDSDKLRDGTVARQRDENRPEPMARLNVSLSHFFGASDELRTARVDPTDPHH